MYSKSIESDFKSSGSKPNPNFLAILRHPLGFLSNRVFTRSWLEQIVGNNTDILLDSKRSNAMDIEMTVTNSHKENVPSMITQIILS